MNTQEEFYPMPSFPTLAVRDLAASTRWYQEVLSFKLVFEIPGASGQTILTHLRWTKYADLLLVSDSPDPSVHESKGLGVTLTFMLFEESVDDLAESAQVKGANIVAGPAIQPWGVKEVAILDPDGYRLVFGQRAIERSWDETLEAIANGLQVQQTKESHDAFFPMLCHPR